MSTNNPTPKPTLDERIQAVVETLELVAAMQRDHEKQMAESAAQWNQRFEKVMNGLERLTHIAEAHEHRIQNLEGGEQH
jgi:hypothetical protein